MAAKEMSNTYLIETKDVLQGGTILQTVTGHHLYIQIQMMLT